MADVLELYLDVFLRFVIDLMSVMFYFEKVNSIAIDFVEVLKASGNVPQKISCNIHTMHTKRKDFNLSNNG